MSVLLVGASCVVAVLLLNLGADLYRRWRDRQWQTGSLAEDEPWPKSTQEE